MDILTLATTAYILSKPFLEKTGEGIARKVGEDIWNLIKMPFIEKGDENVERLAISNQETFTKDLEQQLQHDEEFALQLSELVSKSQNVLSGKFQQNINSHGEIGKQINIQTNSGSIQM
ncbi:hypothetical protein AAKU52_003476 [Pedobacter sp. CG_S7]|uniref:hypothetical protein n=1 Tax=Pedobacter sp. CG_S7 TaxID=3143930 RepID=UPI003399EC54